MMKDYNGTVVLITGGTNGIGGRCLGTARLSSSRTAPARNPRVSLSRCIIFAYRSMPITAVTPRRASSARAAAPAAARARPGRRHRIPVDGAGGRRRGRGRGGGAPGEAISPRPRGPRPPPAPAMVVGVGDLQGPPAAGRRAGARARDSAGLARVR